MRRMDADAADFLMKFIATETLELRQQTASTQN
jgi:hypothetical protein